jgi:nucleotide-binding universal stress UspA family protein
MSASYVCPETVAEAAAVLDEALLIVLTCRRRAAISRMVLGSVADQVMRTANCPVLTVQPKRK